MADQLTRAILAALLAGLLPGYFWERTLSGRRDVPERLACSAAISSLLVPAATLAISWITGGGVTLPVALAAVLAVFLCGLGARLLLGPARAQEQPLLSTPPPFGGFSMGALGMALALVVISMLGFISPATSAPPIVVLLVVAGVVASGALGGGQTAGTFESPRKPLLSAGLLSAALLVTLARGYWGPVVHDWPYLRGGDQFSHAVMAEQMLWHGSYSSYLIYPPGFPTLTAVICRLGRLTPLELFPVLAPALPALGALAAYALSRRLWGWEFGVAAAFLSGVVASSSYDDFAQARYPNFFSAYFLMVLAVAALLDLYRNPSARRALLSGLLGSSVVLYHPVGTLYMALLLACVSVLIVPYLLFTAQRREALTLVLSLSLTAVLSVLWAWRTYDLPHLLSGISSPGGTGRAVAVTIGSQSPPDFRGTLAELSPPVLWLGLLGLLLLALHTPSRKEIAARATLLLWVLILFAGSRTSLSGFPERFSRDLSIPLVAAAAFASVSLVRPAWQAGLPRLLSKTTLVLLCTVVVIQAALGLDAARLPGQAVLTPSLARAGAWLREHNRGGNIISTPYLGRGISNRAVLALGGYTGLQSYREHRIEHPRSLPTAGKRPLLVSQWVLHHPRGGRTARFLRENDVRYIVIYKRYPGVNWRAFADAPDYRRVYENRAIVIFAPKNAQTPGGVV
ncbi:hypothetical protein [Rubrobacter calidifluminis]|uniref:hypothetical protein n=1 Tax=Rubrobacter calidifluminis TaxID=1392640 RepID=UPI002361C88A|nr:hypothetical protein [Rubrobacter calidifluminis]